MRLGQLLGMDACNIDVVKARKVEAIARADVASRRTRMFSTGTWR